MRKTWGSPAPRRAQSALPARGRLEPVGQHQLGARHGRDHELGHAFERLHGDGRVAQVDQQHVYLPPIVAVDRPGGVEHGQPGAGRQTRSRPHLAFEAARNGHPDAGRYKGPRERRDDQRRGERGVQVEARGPFGLVARQGHDDGSDTGNLDAQIRKHGPHPIAHGAGAA